LARKQSPEQFMRAIDREIKSMPYKLKLFFMEAARTAEEERRKGFAGGYGPNGEKWKPLAESTIKRKRRKKYKDPEKPLLAKGTLSKGRIGANTKRGIVRLWESREDISEYHEKGGRGNKPPKRSHFGIYKQAERKIRLSFKRFIESFAKRLARGR